MTRDELEAILRLWQGRLGLERWQITIDWEKPSDDYEAHVQIRGDYEEAEISLCATWHEWNTRNAHGTIVHELLHCLHTDCDKVLRSIDGQLHRDAWDAVDDRYRHELERLIERLAWRLVELAEVR